MHGKKNRGIWLRTNCTHDICTFPRKLAFSHAISHALKAFDSPFSLTVHLSMRALSVSIFFLHLCKMHGREKPRGIGVFVRFRELSSFRNTKTRGSCTFPRKLDFSHAISHALKAFDSPFSLTVSHLFFHARAVGKYLFHSSLQNA